MMNLWTLPTTAEINGREYRINADFRDVLDIIARMTALEQEQEVTLYVCLALFYEDFDEIPEEDYREAVEWMFLFIDCGEPSDGKRHHKTIDWEQDLSVIVSDVNKVAGNDVRGMKFCHWWTFMSWFNGIGEGQLSTIVSIREKLRKGKKLEKWERDFYRENRSKIDFKQRYTSAEEELLKEWT